MVAFFLFFNKPSFHSWAFALGVPSAWKASPLDVDMAHSLTSIQASLKMSLAREGFSDPSI